jgi:hypothetical protein
MAYLIVLWRTNERQRERERETEREREREREERERERDRKRERERCSVLVICQSPFSAPGIRPVSNSGKCLPNSRSGASSDARIIKARAASFREEYGPDLSFHFAILLSGERNRKMLATYADYGPNVDTI